MPDPGELLGHAEQPVGLGQRRSRGIGTPPLAIALSCQRANWQDRQHARQDERLKQENPVAAVAEPQRRRRLGEQGEADRDRTRHDHHQTCTAQPQPVSGEQQQRADQEWQRHHPRKDDRRCPCYRQQEHDHFHPLAIARRPPVRIGQRQKHRRRNQYSQTIGDEPVRQHRHGRGTRRQQRQRGPRQPRRNQRGEECEQSEAGHRRHPVEAMPPPEMPRERQQHERDFRRVARRQRHRDRKRIAIHRVGDQVSREPCRKQRPAHHFPTAQTNRQKHAIRQPDRCDPTSKSRQPDAHSCQKERHQRSDHQ